MFDNVLVGVDGRQGGRDAIALAKALASPAAKLTLAHVYGGHSAGGRVSALAMPLELEAAEELLAHAASEVGGQTQTACSPFRVPIARVAAAQAALEGPRAITEDQRG